jgi:uracil-DNA glycosylase
LSRPITIARVRGDFLKLRDGVEAFVTVHPSSLLRAPDETARALAYEKFVHDMRHIARHVPEIRL